MASEMAASESGSAMPVVQWKTTPDGWKQVAPSGMSSLSFSVAGKGGREAEMSVMAFPGESVGPISLVNVVRENAGMPPLGEEEFSRMTEAVSIGDEKGALIDLTGETASGAARPANKVMLAVLAHGGATWLFKLAGDSETVASQKPAMVDFLKSVSFAKGSGALPPHGHGMASTNTKRVPSDSSAPALDVPNPPAASHPAWEVPASWKEVPPSQMLLAKFLVNGAGGNADVTVSSFPGEVGGLLANVNRWRRQAGLGALTQEQMEKEVTVLDVPGGKATVVDLSGKDPETGNDMRLIGVVWPRPGETWFYKLKGDSPVAEKEKPAFLKFVQSVRYPNG